MVTRRAVTFGGLLALGGLPRAASAQEEAWPAKEIKLMAPFAAGGGADLIARLLAERLTLGLGKQVIVENQGGGGGTIAAATVARARPDGYTFIAHTVSTAVINALTYKSLPYDPIGGFSAVSLFVRSPLVAATGPGFPARTLPEFIALCRKNPGAYSYASSGLGSVAHLAGELLKTQAGIDIVHVPYRSNALALGDLISNRVHLVFDGLAPAVPLVKDGRYRPLAVTTRQRSPALPNIPTMNDYVPGYELPYWIGLFAPAKTPQRIVERAAEALARGMTDAPFRQRLADLGNEGVGSTPQELDAFWRAQLAYYTPLVAKANISL